MNVMLYIVAASAVSGVTHGVVTAASGIYSGVSALGRGLSWLTAPSVPPPSMKETVEALSAVRTAVTDREKELQEKMEEHREKSKAYAESGKLREARLQIRLRMLYDSQLQNVQRTITAIESHLCALQSAELNRSVLVALHDSSRALGRRGYEEDAVDDMLEKLDEQHAQTRDILDMINTPSLDAASLDESDIDAELRSLLPAAATEAPQQNEYPATMIQFPTVPDTPLMVPASKGPASSCRED
jgi:hypothetical protein